MPENKNALAELAEDLEVLKMILEWEHHPKGLKVAEKAQRIVAELAKVPFDSQGAALTHESWIAVTNCRAIAEEGAK